MPTPSSSPPTLASQASAGHHPNGTIYSSRIATNDQWLDALESFGDVERLTALAWAAGQELELPADEVNEALRRAVVVRAVGGDPTRELALDETAVRRLAEELDAPERRDALLAALAAIPHAAAAALVDDPDLAWRCFAAALLADQLA
jgi:hypothetical protein